jgi:hypothetical protein
MEYYGFLWERMVIYGKKPVCQGILGGIIFYCLEMLLEFAFWFFWGIMGIRHAPFDRLRVTPREVAHF